jgi:hypothetical protein
VPQKTYDAKGEGESVASGHARGSIKICGALNGKCFLLDTLLKAICYTCREENFVEEMDLRGRSFEHTNLKLTFGQKVEGFP